MMASGPALIVFNAGSSSLKFEVFAERAKPAERAKHAERRHRAPESLVDGAVSDLQGPAPSLRIGDGSPEPLPAFDGAGGLAGAAGEAAALVLDRLTGGHAGVGIAVRDIAATAHRVVHGGETFTAPVAVTAAVLDALRALTPLAPLHNPVAIAVIEAVGERLPDLPAVAVFDTAFFADLPPAARSYAVPEEWARHHGIRRYGFHGLAHEYMARRLRETGDNGTAGGQRAPSRAISLHLGHGCSAAALRDGRPVETSMGFTPLEGLVMGTRAGDLDPGIVFWLARSGWSIDAIDDALNARSGLLGLSGVSSDSRELLALAAEGHEGAALSLQVFYHRLHKYLGAYTAILGGLDALVFGGGIGEHSAEVRAGVAAGLGWLGLELDQAANEAAVGRDGRISSAGSSIDVQVVRVDEESMIAEAALGMLPAILQQQ